MLISLMMRKMKARRSQQSITFFFSNFVDNYEYDMGKVFQCWTRGMRFSYHLHRIGGKEDFSLLDS